MSTVDVVVPCYNYARFLSRCVESVLSQSDVAVRVLIIDDASGDDTALVGESLAAGDPRVEFRRHAQNRGHIATYNEGLLGWAQAHYSVLLSADDALAPGALGRAVRLMDAHRNVSMTYGMAVIVGDVVNVDAASKTGSEEFQIIPGAAFVEHCCAFTNPVPTPTAVVRTALQHRLGGYRADLPHTGDMEMWMRFALHGDVGVLRSIQGYYRWHQGNMSTRYYGAVLSDQRERLRACSEVIAKWGSDSPQSRRWLEAASNRLAHEAFWLANRAFDSGDLADSAVCLAFAEEIYPELRRSGAWRRFHAKRRLGHSLWRQIYPMLDLARRLRRGRAASRERVSHFQPGALTGWWPGAPC
jgi:glycosyltransferase involved in cell wall biosynthesis